jgi:hypothetical protein
MRGRQRAAGGEQVAAQQTKRKQGGKRERMSHGWSFGAGKIHFDGKLCAEGAGLFSRNSVSPERSDVRPKPVPNFDVGKNTPLRATIQALFLLVEKLFTPPELSGDLPKSARPIFHSAAG